MGYAVLRRRSCCAQTKILLYFYMQGHTEETCNLEIKDGVVNGLGCQQMDKFQDFVREMVQEGSVKNMVQTLAVLAGAEKRRATAALESAAPVTQPGKSMYS